MLSSDLQTLDKFLKQSRLIPHSSKNDVTVFKLIDYNMEINFRWLRLKYVLNPKYLGVILDGSLSFNDHLANVTSKIDSRINIIQKLTSTDRGADFSTLRTFTVILDYSMVEYCAPIWLNSAYVKNVETRLNQSTRIISGAIKSTPVDWLPVLSNIFPLQHRRRNSITLITLINLIALITSPFPSTNILYIYVDLSRVNFRGKPLSNSILLVIIQKNAKKMNGKNQG